MPSTFSRTLTLFCFIFASNLLSLHQFKRQTKRQLQSYNFILWNIYCLCLCIFFLKKKFHWRTWIKKIQRINAYKVFHISSNRFVSHCIVSSMINSHVYCWMNNDIECYYSNIDFVNLWPLFSSMESKQHQELLFFENCKYKKYANWIGWHSWTWNPTDATMCAK